PPPPGPPGNPPGNSRLSVACLPRESPPQPDSTATYCLPSTLNVVGGARMPEFVGNSQSSFPVDASNAWNLRSAVPPLKTMPPALTSMPPQFGDLSYTCVQTFSAVSTFHACTSPT